VPFVSKATGTPWAKIAALLMSGRKLRELNVREPSHPDFVSVKAVVFPFQKFPGVDTILGPEMKSTGEVMGIDEDFSGGFAKAMLATYSNLPSSGTAFLSVMDKDKEELPELASSLTTLGFDLVATEGTAAYLSARGFAVKAVNKVRQGSPHVVDMLGEGKIVLVVNTPEGSRPLLDSRSIRLVASELGVPTYTTMAAAGAAVKAISKLKRGSSLQIKTLQEHHSQASIDNH
jgi:carbamoyl-phosphate synthase large subunit